MRTETSRLLRRAAACMALAGAFIAAATAMPASATGTISVSPQTLVFPHHPVVGAPCPGAGCDYATVTIHNGTARAKTLSTVSTSAPFWPTYGGTCNTPDKYRIPAHASCSFQFGFKPSTPNTRSTAKATLHFTNGAAPVITLVGTSHA